jgi:tubulin alpha
MTRCIGEANYHQMNHIIALLNSAMTGEFWDISSSKGSLVRERQSLVPFPELNTVVSAYVPLLPYGSRTLLTEEAFTSEAFAANHECATINMQTGKYYACLLIYRGNINSASNHRLISSIRHGPYDFVDWIPTSFSMAYVNQPVNHGIYSQKITTPAKSLVKVSNHSEMIPQTIARIHKDFDMLLSRRAFIDWYTREGLEEGEFADASEAVKHMVDTAAGLLGDAPDEQTDDE